MLPERVTFDRAIAGARAALGDAGFAAAWAAGQAAPTEQVLDEASAFLASVASRRRRTNRAAPPTTPG